METPGSKYQIGKPWMIEPESKWPCKKSFSPAPEEEFRKDMLEGACKLLKSCSSHGKEVMTFQKPEKEGWSD
jgi:hypothetical protein